MNGIFPIQQARKECGRSTVEYWERVAAISEGEHVGSCIYDWKPARAHTHAAAAATTTTTTTTERDARFDNNDNNTTITMNSPP